VVFAIVQEKGFKRKQSRVRRMVGIPLMYERGRNSLLWPLINEAADFCGCWFLEVVSSCTC
jgi:hypothetical protein